MKTTTNEGRATGNWQISKITRTHQCFDGLAVEGVNHYTGEPIFWLVEARYVAANADYDTTGATVEGDDAKRICSKYGIVTG